MWHLKALHLLILFQIDQQISDWWSPFGSIVFTLVHAFFESEPKYRDSESAHKEYCLNELKKNCFLYGPFVQVPNSSKVHLQPRFFISLMWSLVNFNSWCDFHSEANYSFRHSLITWTKWWVHMLFPTYLKHMQTCIHVLPSFLLPLAYVSFSFLLFDII